MHALQKYNSNTAIIVVLGPDAGAHTPPTFSPVTPYTAAAAAMTNPKAAERAQPYAHQSHRAMQWEAPLVCSNSSFEVGRH